MLNGRFKPIISVIMPVYNCADFVGEAVQSILDQTYSQFELIIIDDNSTDNTTEVVKSYRDDRIQIIEKSVNTGYTESLNLGIDLSCGELIARMDGDDISMPERFEKQVAFMNTYPHVSVCGTNFEILDTGKVVHHPTDDEDIRIAFLNGCYLAHPSAIIRASVLKKEKLKYDPAREPAEDYDLWIKLLKISQVANLNEVLLKYRIHSQQISLQNAEKQVKQADVARIEMLKSLLKLNNLEKSQVESHLALMKTDTSTGVTANVVESWITFLLEENERKSAFDQQKLKLFLKKLGDKYYNKYFLLNSKPHPSLLLEYLTSGHYKTFSLNGSLSIIARSSFKWALIEASHPKQLYNKILTRFDKKKEKFILSQFRASVVNKYNILLNPLCRRQKKNIRSIPIIINNYNQLTSVVNMIEHLEARGYQNIIILDNNSNYPPLLDFYEKTSVEVIRLGINHGHMAFWKEKKVFEQFNKGYYVLTDPDIRINEKCPANFLEHFIDLLETHPMLTKAGFALKIDDLPEHYPLKEQAINWENQFWTTPVIENAFLAIIDTTFALYRPFVPLEKRFSAAIRVAGHFTARHEGWYKDPNNPTEEEKHYMLTANESSTWVLNEQKKVRKNAKKYL